MKTLKPPKTFEEQLSLLESRGMIIDDRNAAIDALQSFNYYRLTGYALQFKDAARNVYFPDTRFSTIIRLYEFDAQLRNIVIRYLETVEVRARTQIAYTFSHAFGSYGHYAYWNFSCDEYFEEFQASCKTAIKKNKDQPAIAHHLKCYSDSQYENIPLWVLVEILSFSTISKLYAAMPIDLQHNVASAFRDDLSSMGNHLHCMSVLRNTCAHYGRLYNSTLSPAIKFPRPLLQNYTKTFNCHLDTSKIYAYLLCMILLLPSPVDAYELVRSVNDLIDMYSAYVDLSLLGMPSDWDNFAFGLIH